MLILLILVALNFWSFSQINFYKQLPDPPPAVTTSFHINGHEDAWIQEVREDGTVLVQIVDDKTNIFFKPAKKDLHRFRRPIAAVTFECGKKPEEKCDLSEPYKLYINNVLVQLLEIKKTAQGLK